VTLGLIALAMGLLWWWSRRLAQAGGQFFSKTPCRLKIIERRWIDARHSIWLIEADGELHLLATGSGQAAWQRLQPKPSQEIQA